MVAGLIDTASEESIGRKLFSYYKKLYPEMRFQTLRKKLRASEIGAVLYTYPGEEEVATTGMKIAEIEAAYAFNYDTPAILFEIGKKRIVIDGHRRLLAAYKNKKGWWTRIIRVKNAKKGTHFGIEKIILNAIRNLPRKIFI